MRLRSFSFVAVFAAISLGAGADQIRVVGSSTVFPVISSLAEEFGRFSAYRTPVIESVGSGMGFNMFCAGSGQGTPDIVMSSRKIKDAEVELCGASGVRDMIEIGLGYDGIVIASSKQKDQVDFSLTDLFSALSKYSLSDEYGKVPTNKYGTWSEVHSSLPEHEIEVYGPHKNTGTYDILVDTVIRGVCMSAKNFVDSYPNLEERKNVCSSIRNDGKYIEVATSENVVIHKISKNSNAFGILSFSFLIKNQREIQGNKVAGVEPSYETISSGKYVLSRPIYIYVKREHLDSTPGLREFVQEVLRPESIGNSGYLVNLGFVPLQQEQLEQMIQRVSKLISG
ncbi:substrate-binding domain-containing protein [Anaplasma capra]|uniref:substrate-binding domain-containing protein n=1 Tax=Anaplasma capra TaxID=1562740 RepID=UPI0021D599A5|nr:substrate-binding domain-containing protein [Anaplasma capra]MCU7611858.1 substrate-binding domain-containing protein [Anaplasma capra]MCU7612666.1 substrate-binding domain-containing protein [Anaplasma capra]